MRVAKVLGSLVAATFTLVAITAFAADEYGIAAGGGKVTVTPKGAWHVNKEYPWKLKCGEKAITFTLTDTKAEATGGSGSCTVKGGVCSGDKCKNFEEAVNL
jgi:hypothetical protein